MRTIYIIRHGQTLWSKSGQHTSYTDLSLTEHGITEVKTLKKGLPSFDHVLISPLKRAQETAHILELKGQTVPDLVEWNYGILEGKTRVEITKMIPNWTIFTHGALYGESVLNIQKRADRFIAYLRTLKGKIAVISSSHILRVVVARWTQQPCEFGAHVILSTASLSILEEDRGVPVISRLNQPPL